MSLIPDETGSDDRPRTEQLTQTPTLESAGLGATNGATKCLNGAKKV